MSTRAFDPLRLEVHAFAKEGARLDGCWPLARLERIADSTPKGTAADRLGEVVWSARGELRPMRGGEAQTWLHVSAHTDLPLECQRCLQPVSVALRVERSFLFVHGEDTAAQLDADSEDDVLAMTHALDLRALIEDELLLAMPIVPRHEVCPSPLPVSHEEAFDDDKPNPFAALAALRRGGPVN